MGNRVIRTLHHKPGLLRRIGRSLAFVAVALYALAPAIPAQWMPYYMMLAMPGMDAMATMPDMARQGATHQAPAHQAPAHQAPAHQAMAHQGHGATAEAAQIPPEAFCPNPGVIADQDGGAKPAATDDGGCPICKVAGAVVMLAAAPSLPLPKNDAQAQPVFHRWHAPSHRIAAAQPRGPPQQA